MKWDVPVLGKDTSPSFIVAHLPIWEKFDFFIFNFYTVLSRSLKLSKNKLICDVLSRVLSYLYALEFAITRPRSSGGEYFISRTRRAAAKKHSRQHGKDRQRRHNHDEHAHEHHEGKNR